MAAGIVIDSHASSQSLARLLDRRRLPLRLSLCQVDTDELLCQLTPRYDLDTLAHNLGRLPELNDVDNLLHSARPEAEEADELGPTEVPEDVLCAEEQLGVRSEEGADEGGQLRVGEDGRGPVSREV